MDGTASLAPGWLLGAKANGIAILNDVVMNESICATKSNPRGDKTADCPIRSESYNVDEAR